MKYRTFDTVQEIANWRLCAGCGACAAVCPENALRLLDIQEQGIRPLVDSARCNRCGECVKVCPGISLSHEPFSNQTLIELRQAWGPVLEVWEGYASDTEVRYKGSSGGAVTALALSFLAREDGSGVLHIGANPEAPLVNVPVFSRTREELLAYIGSRYSPAAPCSGIEWIRASKRPCVFIGKPCDVAALRKLQILKPELKNKVGLAISIFCAGTPSSDGNKAIFDVLGVREEEVEEIRYRGFGWPGFTVVKVKGGSNQTRRMTYEQSWGGILSKHVPLRCRLCPDGTGEFADISCGDPWYRGIEPNEPGWSLILARTVKGREFLHSAVESGYIRLVQAEPRILTLSQKSLLNKRRNLWGRIVAMRIMKVPVPHYTGFSLFKNWLDLSAVSQLRSVIGTLRRVMLRMWRKPVKPSIPARRIQEFINTTTNQGKSREN